MEKIDWFVIISDLQRHKISMSRLAKFFNVSERTIANWKCVNEPKFSTGYRLIELWKNTTGQTETPKIKKRGVNYD